MDELPDDIKQTATRFAGEYMASDISCARLFRDVAAVIFAERKRSASAAQAYLQADTYDWGSLPENVAEAILSGEPV